MTKTALPQAQDWNNFWSLEETQKFTKISWSKRRIIDVLTPHVGPNKRALDAGCGSGFFSKFFCDQGMITTALDYSIQALDIAKKMTQGRAMTLQKDLVSAKLSQDTNDRYDLIFSDGLLEHFSPSDQDKIFQNWVSVLNKDGVIITFVPNRWSPWELIRPFFMPGIEEKPFVLEQLVKLNERNGLHVIKKGGVNTLPWAFSPDKIIGPAFGMLLFTISRKHA